MPVGAAGWGGWLAVTSLPIYAAVVVRSAPYRATRALAVWVGIAPAYVAASLGLEFVMTPAKLLDLPVRGAAILISGSALCAWFVLNVWRGASWALAVVGLLVTAAVIFGYDPSRHAVVALGQFAAVIATLRVVWVIWVAKIRQIRSAAVALSETEGA